MNPDDSKFPDPPERPESCNREPDDWSEADQGRVSRWLHYLLSTGELRKIKMDIERFVEWTAVRFSHPGSNGEPAEKIFRILINVLIPHFKGIDREAYLREQIEVHFCRIVAKFALREGPPCCSSPGGHWTEENYDEAARWLAGLLRDGTLAKLPQLKAVTAADVEYVAGRLPAFGTGDPIFDNIHRILKHACVPGFIPPGVDGMRRDPLIVRFCKTCASLGRFFGPRPGFLSEEDGIGWDDADKEIMGGHFFGEKLVKGEQRFPADSNPWRIAGAFATFAVDLGFEIVRGGEGQHWRGDSDATEDPPETASSVVSPWVKSIDELYDLVSDFRLHVVEKMVRNFKRSAGMFEAYSFGTTSMRRFLQSKWMPRGGTGRSVRVERTSSVYVPAGDHTLLLAACLKPSLRAALFLVVNEEPEENIPSLIVDWAKTNKDQVSTPGDAAAALWSPPLETFWKGFSDGQSMAVFLEVRRLEGEPVITDPIRLKREHDAFRQEMSRLRVAHEFIGRLIEAGCNKDQNAAVLRVCAVFESKTAGLREQVKMLLALASGSRLPLILIEKRELGALKKEKPADTERLWDAPLLRMLFEAVRSRVCDIVHEFPILRMLILRSERVANCKVAASLLPGGDKKAVMEFFFGMRPETDPPSDEVIEFVGHLNRLYVAREQAAIGVSEEMRLANLCELHGEGAARAAFQRLVCGYDAPLPAADDKVRIIFALTLRHMLKCSTGKKRGNVTKDIQRHYPALKERLKTMLVLDGKPAAIEITDDNERNALQDALFKLLG